MCIQCIFKVAILVIGKCNYYKLIYIESKFTPFFEGKKIIEQFSKSIKQKKFQLVLKHHQVV